MIALRPGWQVKAVGGALHINQGQDAAPGEGEMSGKADGQTTHGLLEGGVEGLRNKAAVGSSLCYRLCR